MGGRFGNVFEDIIQELKDRLTGKEPKTNWLDETKYPSPKEIK